MAKAIAPDQITDAKLGTTPARGRDSADDVAADHKRERCRYAINSRADQGVDRVDGRTQYVDEDVGWARLGSGYFPDPNLLGRSKFFDVGSAHGGQGETSGSESPVS